MQMLKIPAIIPYCDSSSPLIKQEDNAAKITAKITRIAKKILNGLIFILNIGLAAIALTVVAVLLVFVCAYWKISLPIIFLILGCIGIDTKCKIGRMKQAGRLF